MTEKRMEKRAKLLGIPMHQIPTTSMAEVQAVAGGSPAVSGTSTPVKSATPKKASPPNSNKKVSVK